MSEISKTLYDYNGNIIYPNTKLNNILDYDGSSSGSSSGSTTPVQTTNRLNGKRIGVIGDSYVYGHTLGTDKVWCKLIANRNNMTCFNYGVNGGKLAGTGGVVERYTSMETNLDYVIVFAGHNDSSSSIEIGTETDTGITTFYGALNTLCKGLQTKYPKARILFMTPSKRTGKEKAYADAMIIACRNYSIQCYDTYGKLGILIGTTPVSSGNANQKSIFELGNSIHLNEKGQEYLSYKIESELLSL